MKHMGPIIKRELLGYFRSPVAYVFIVIFLISTAGTTWYLGNFYTSDEASLESFFFFHPWLYLFLIPAVGMRLWAEDRRTGTVEILLTLPHEITLAGPVKVRCLGRIKRAESDEPGRIGMVAQIERYEFLRGDEHAA